MFRQSKCLSQIKLNYYLITYITSNSLLMLITLFPLWGRGNSMIHVIQFPKSKFKKNVFAARKREPPPRLPWCYLPVRNNTLCECWSVAFNPSSVFWCKFEFILKRFSFLAVVFLWVSWGGGGLRRGGSYLCQTQWAN